jgi:hypothetical protein
MLLIPLLPFSGVHKPANITVNCKKYVISISALGFKVTKIYLI